MSYVTNEGDLFEQLLEKVWLACGKVLVISLDKEFVKEDGTGSMFLVTAPLKTNKHGAPLTNWASSFVTAIVLFAREHFPEIDTSNFSTFSFVYFDYAFTKACNHSVNGKVWIENRGPNGHDHYPNLHTNEDPSDWGMSGIHLTHALANLINFEINRRDI